MTKIEVISQKPSKNWISVKNCHFVTVFGRKWPIFEFFPKIRLEHFFTFPKPYLTAKFQKKIMNGCLDMSVTHAHTYIRTYIQGSTYRSACGETKKLLKYAKIGYKLTKDPNFYFFMTSSSHTSEN